MNTQPAPGPLPWKAAQSGSIYDSQFNHLGHFPKGENAQLAISAVNSHAELLSALEGLCAAVKEHNSKQSSLGDCIIEPLCTAQDVIQRAKGGK